MGIIDFLQKKKEEREVAIATSPENWHGTREATRNRDWDRRQKAAIKSGVHSSGGFLSGIGRAAANFDSKEFERRNKRMAKMFS